MRGYWYARRSTTAIWVRPASWYIWNASIRDTAIQSYLPRGNIDAGLSVTHLGRGNSTPTAIGGALRSRVLSKPAGLK